MLVKRIIFRGFEIELEEPMNLSDTNDKDVIIFEAFKLFNDKIKELHEKKKELEIILNEKLSAK